MIKVFASALFLAMLVAAPVDRASAGILIDVDCAVGWTIEAGGTKGDGLLTIKNLCTDPITVVLTGKKGPKEIGVVLPTLTKSIYFKISKNEKIDVIQPGLATGTFLMEVSK